MAWSRQQRVGGALAVLGAALFAVGLPLVPLVASGPGPVPAGPRVEVAPQPADPVPLPDTRARGAVKGRVVDAMGRPVVGAVAKIDTEQGSYAAQTIRGGDFRIEAPVGRHILYATQLVGKDEVVGPPLLIDVKEAGTAGYELVLPADGTVGIGAVLDLAGDAIAVTWAEEGRAAYAAGVRSGDRLLAIDGVSTDRMGVLDAERLLQGPTGSEVRLTVAAEGAVPRDVVVRRRAARVP